MNQDLSELPLLGDLSLAEEPLEACINFMLRNLSPWGEGPEMCLCQPPSVLTENCLWDSIDWQAFPAVTHMAKCPEEEERQMLMLSD